jgi:hypothetical protein
MAPPTSEEKKACCERLDAAYRDRFAAIGGGFSAWAGGTKLGVEALFGGRVGPVWSTSIRFGKRPGYWIGPLRMIMSLPDAESRIRQEIDEYLTAHQPAPGGAK